MRILQVISSVNPVGGGPIEVVLRQGEALQRLGHGVEVACVDEPGAPWVESAPLKVHALGAPGPGRSNYGYAPALEPWLRQHAGKYDAAVVNGLWQYHSLAVWRALRRAKTPYFVFPHGMLDPWFKRAHPLKHAKKCLYWLGAEHRVLRDAAGTCFTCEEERVLARQSFRPYRPREVVVAFGTARPPGDAQKQRELFFERFPSLKAKRLLLFLGRIHPKKGCDLLIDAFASAARSDDSLHLVMAGPDQAGWQPALQQQAHECGVAERVTWAGMLEGDLKWGAFRAAEAFALPSHQENFGIAVAESLACGVPVLISDKVNIWREIQDDGAGLVEPDTAQGTSRLLDRWLSLPREQKDEMGRRALACFEKHFEIEGAAKSLLSVLGGRSSEHPQVLASTSRGAGGGGS